MALLRWLYMLFFDGYAFQLPGTYLSRTYSSIVPTLLIVLVYKCKVERERLRH
jgi:hypothetical protein